jgi:hypothetical protein
VLVLETNDERALALSIAAFLEESLERLLTAFMQDVSASKDLLDGFNAPFGTLSAKAKAAYALGLISANQYADINTARKIRNEFAHRWTGVSLADHGNRERVLNLTEPNLGEVDPDASLADRFRNCLIETILTIEFTAQFVERAKMQAIELKPDFINQVTTKG